MEQRQELRKAGLKVTLPRLKILEIFVSSKSRHMSAEDMYKELLEAGEDIGLATVYRVLTQFEAAGLVTRHNFEGRHSVFELDDGETVFATGCTHLLALAHSENWLKYGVSFPELDRYLADINQVDVWVPEKDGERPSIVLLSRRSPRGIGKWLAKYYVPIDAPEFEIQRVNVYALIADDPIGGQSD